MPETVLGRTLFDTPIITPLLRGISWLWLKIAGWRPGRGGRPPPPPLRGRALFAPPPTPPLLRGISWLWLKIAGWRLVPGELPAQHRFVLIAAPHTSNWDLPIMLFAALRLRVKLYWMGKDAIFRPPFGGIARWMGGIPNDRSKANNLVAQSVGLFHGRPSLVLVVPPGGARPQ